MSTYLYRWGDGPWGRATGGWSSDQEFRRALEALNPERVAKGIALEIKRPEHGGPRTGAGRPKGSRNQNPRPMARTERVFASVSSHTLEMIELWANTKRTTVHGLLSDVIEVKFRCKCGKCKAARRALRKENRHA